MVSRIIRLFACALVSCLLATFAWAQPAPELQAGWPRKGPEIDLALVLAVDISYSMDMDEQALQREGYRLALTSRPMLDAIRTGFIGKIAVTYIEWAGTGSRNIIADWMIIEDQASAEAFARILAETPIHRARRTSLSNAIDFAMERLQSAPYQPLRRVIDISGDGPNNQGAPVTERRDLALQRGITINGLPILPTRSLNSMFDIPNLDAYYRDCVIGGPGAFMITIAERTQFQQAIRSKILREVADDAHPARLYPQHQGLPVIKTGGTAAPYPVAEEPTDCLIGEKLWQQNQGRN